jgi:hypothetical protein
MEQESSVAHTQFWPRLIVCVLVLMIGTIVVGEATRSVSLSKYTFSRLIWPVVIIGDEL